MSENTLYPTWKQTNKLKLEEDKVMTCVKLDLN